MYYKRACDHRWRGLAAVLEKDGQQVLVKHAGGILVYWHSCRLAFEHDTRYQEKNLKNKTSAETENKII